MDNRAIGVFDSGMGGLTAVRELISFMPGEDIVYFGDTGRVPYGGRSAETIVKYAKQDVAFLRTFDLKAILVACNTVSTTALSVLKKENDLPILDVVEPAALAAMKATRGKRIGIIGTKATIRSNAYAEIIQKEMPEAELFSAACPLFVPLVEDGRVRRGDRVVELVTEEYLRPLKECGVDTLVLGCTHYPLLWDVISDFMGSDVTLINSGKECSLSLKRLLTERDMLNSKETDGVRHYYASDSAEDFADRASVFLGVGISGLAERVEIERY